MILLGRLTHRTARPLLEPLNFLGKITTRFLSSLFPVPLLPTAFLSRPTVARRGNTAKRNEAQGYTHKAQLVSACDQKPKPNPIHRVEVEAETEAQV